MVEGSRVVGNVGFRDQAAVATLPILNPHVVVLDGKPATADGIIAHLTINKPATPTQVELDFDIYTPDPVILNKFTRRTTGDYDYGVVFLPPDEGEYYLRVHKLSGVEGQRYELAGWQNYYSPGFLYIKKGDVLGFRIPTPQAIRCANIGLPSPYFLPAATPPLPAILDTLVAKTLTPTIYADLVYSENCGGIRYDLGKLTVAGSIVQQGVPVNGAIVYPPSTQRCTAKYFDSYDTPPANPQHGQLWFDSVKKRWKVYDALEGKHAILDWQYPTWSDDFTVLPDGSELDSTKWPIVDHGPGQYIYGGKLWLKSVVFPPGDFVYCTARSAQAFRPFEGGTLTVMILGNLMDAPLIGDDEILLFWDKATGSGGTFFRLLTLASVPHIQSWDGTNTYLQPLTDDGHLYGERWWIFDWTNSPTRRLRAYTRDITPPYAYQLRADTPICPRASKLTDRFRLDLFANDDQNSWVKRVQVTAANKIQGART